MKAMLWLVMIAAACGLAYGFWRMRRRLADRQRTEDERMKAFMAQAMPAGAAAPPLNPPAQNAAPKVDPAALSLQQFLFDAATKAGLAGEAALSIQLYARLLSRFPETALAAQARSAVEAQKKKLAKA